MVVAKTATVFFRCCQVLAFASRGQQAAGQIKTVWPEQDQASSATGIPPAAGVRVSSRGWRRECF